MPFCTIVEFEFGEELTRDQFEKMIAGSGEAGTIPRGCLSRIAGIDDNGARVIEVWQSQDDARAYAEQSASRLQAGHVPPPSRVSAFEVTSYVTS